MRFLKVVLYLILSVCLLWGITITLGPTIIGIALSRSFDEQEIRLTGLSISPKLQISASRAEFDFSYDGHFLHGVARAPKVKISLSRNGWLVQVSSGLLKVNNTINLSSLKVDFRTDSITNINAGQVSINTPELSLKDHFELRDIKISSDMILSSLSLQNLVFSADSASILTMQNDNRVLLDVITGRLAKLSVRQNWQSQRLDFELDAETSQLQSDRFGQIIIQSLLLEALNDGPVVESILVLDSISMIESGLYLKNIKADPSVDLITMKFQKETRVQIEQGRFERTELNQVSGNLTAFDAVVGLSLPERYFEGVGKFNDLEVWKDQISVVTIPDLKLDIKAMISEIDVVQAVRAQFKAVINGYKGSVVTGDLTSQMSHSEGQDCLTQTCVASDILLGFKYEFEGEQVIGKGSCPSGQCDDETFSLSLETSNSSKIVKGLSNQKIINPLALVLFAGGIMQGQEIGRGHKIEF